MELGRLTTIFDADDAKMTAVSKRVENTAKKTAKTIEQETKRAQQAARQAAAAVSNDLSGALSTLSPGLASLAGAAGPLSAVAAGLVAVGAAGVGIVKLATFSQQLGGEIFDLSQKINFSAETLSSLKVAAELSGGSLASLATAFGIFDRNMEEAKDTSSEMSRLFKALKIDTEDNEKALRQAFTALAGLANGAQQTALAMKLFGRSGKEVLGIVKETGGNVDDFIAKMRDMGLVITTDGAKKADKFGDSLVILQGKLEALARQIGSELVPTVSRAADDISKWLKENQNEIANTAKELASLVSGFYSLAKVVASPFVAQIIIMRRLIDVPAGGVAGLAGSIGASVASGLGASPEALRRAGRISAQGEGEGEFVIPGSSVPAAPPLPPALNLGRGGGGRGGGGGRRAKKAKATGPDFDEYYNLFDFLKKEEEDRVERNKRIADEMDRQHDRMIDMVLSARTMEGMEFGPGSVATPMGDFEKFIREVEPPDFSKEHQALIDMREQMREQMMELGQDLTSVFSRAIGEGFEQGAKRGLQSLALGLLDIVQNVFLKKMAEGLGNMLSGAATGGGGGFLSGLLKAIGIGALGGAAGGGLGSAKGAASLGPWGSVGMFASGGYLAPGKMGIAGENGPELIYGGQSGMTITPQGGGGVVNNISINLPPAPRGNSVTRKSTRQQAEAVVAALQGAQR